jgi:DNA (cytosine-5)-methyltransferase 1
MSQAHHQLLEEIYNQVLAELEARDFVANPSKELNIEVINWIEIIAKNSENFLGVLNVTITSLTEKIVSPNQDIRKHQAKMEGGYSGRTLDTKTIAPWLKSKKLKSMVESGWLTRSLEQDSPYTLDYKGAIRNKEVKEAFLQLLNFIQKDQAKTTLCLKYLLQLLIIQREQNKVEINPLAKKSKYSIAEIIDLLTKHFAQTSQVGTARLPVLAIYSVYQIIVKEVGRYEEKTLQPLGSHTSADLRSGDIGDIQINDKNDKPFEGVEVKYGKLIDHVLVEDAFEKIKQYPVNRYYLLSTEITTGEELVKIQTTIDEISKQHGCQVIVNGLIPTIKYYLRLISDTDDFLQNYTDNIINDPAIKIDHKRHWKNLVENSTNKN